MIESRARRLRELTDQYYHGLIDFAAYRAERARLLDGLSGLSGDDDTDTLEVPRPGPASTPAPSPAAALEAVREPSPPQQPRPFLDRRQKASAPPRRALWWAVGMVAVTVVALGLWLLVPRIAERRVEPSASQPAAAAAPESLIDDFLALDSWDEKAVSRFLFEWDELPGAQQGRLRDSETFRRFVGEVRRRIMVDRAVGAPAFRGRLSLTEALSVELEMGLVAARADTPGDEALPDRVAATASAAADAAGESSASGDVGPQDAQSAGAGSGDAGSPDGAAETPGRSSAPVSQDVAALSPRERSRKAATGPAPDPREVREIPGSRSPEAEDPARTAPTNRVVETAGAAASGDALPERLTRPRQAGVPRLESDQPCSVDRLNVRSATCWDLLAEDVRAPLLRVLPAGSFLMGDAEDASASPPHEQVIERPFAIGMFEVSHDEYQQFCRETDHPCPARRWASGEHPVVDVNWQDAQAYVNWLSGRTGASYRLPTEAEWEYAARAGSTARYPFGDEIDPTFARYDSGVGHGGALPATDRTTRRNGYRLMHMAGNVRELTADSWRDDYEGRPDDERVAVRGGSYADSPERLRSAAREGVGRTGADSRTGFRVVRDL